ncbi:hypothetical protein N9Q58_01030 [Polaribacter sp.]|nr:hypothetical protein [Polaribacter sp.]
MNNKQKNKVLLVSFLLILVLSYVFSIRKTVELKSKLVNLSNDKKILLRANKTITSLQQENDYLDSVLRQKDIYFENSFQQTLLKKLNDFSKRTSMDIISFKQPHIYSNKTTVLMSYEFQVKGNFKSLLQLTNTLERQQLGELISVNFDKKRNYRNNRDELTGLFYIQKRNQRKE